MSVCLFICGQQYSKGYERIVIEIVWRGLGWYNEELIKFWWVAGSSKMSIWAKNIIAVE